MEIEDNILLTLYSYPYISAPSSPHPHPPPPPHLGLAWWPFHAIPRVSSCYCKCWFNTLMQHFLDTWYHWRKLNSMAQEIVHHCDIDCMKKYVILNCLTATKASSQAFDVHNNSISCKLALTPSSSVKFLYWIMTLTPVLLALLVIGVLRTTIDCWPPAIYLVCHLDTYASVCIFLALLPYCEHWKALGDLWFKLHKPWRSFRKWKPLPRHDVHSLWISILNPSLYSWNCE